MAAASGAEAVLQAADRIAANAQAVSDIRELHKPYQAVTGNGQAVDVCIQCRIKCPCPTIAILERHGL